MDDFLVAGPADNPEEALALMRATAIASFGEAVRQIARENFQYCKEHRRAVPRPEGSAEIQGESCVCPTEPAAGVPKGPTPGDTPSGPPASHLPR